MTPQHTHPELLAVENCPAEPAFRFVFNSRPMYLFAQEHGFLRERAIAADIWQYVYSHHLEEMYTLDPRHGCMRDHRYAARRYERFLTALQDEAADILHQAFPTLKVRGVTPLTFTTYKEPDPAFCNILILLARTLRDCDCWYHRAYFNDWAMWDVWAALTSHTILSRHAT